MIEQIYRERECSEREKFARHIQEINTKKERKEKILQVLENLRYMPYMYIILFFFIYSKV